jgi:hypothetical protein
MILVRGKKIGRERERALDEWIERGGLQIRYTLLFKDIR